MSAAEGVRATTASGERAKAASAPATFPPLWLCGVHLAALWTLAFVQPLFDLLGKNAAFFVARDNTPGDILILAFGFTLLPPLVMTALVAIARAARPAAGRAVHLLFVTLLAGTLVLQLVKGLSPSPAVVLPIAVLLGAGVAFAYSRSVGLRTFASILGVAPVVVIALLVVFSPVSDIVFPKSEPAAADGAGTASTTPVVVLIFDELPTMTLMTASHEVDQERFPAFAELASSSTWYRSATSVSDGTYVAVPAILTGQRPDAELPTSRSYPNNLFSLLGRTYDMHVEEPITHVCPQTLCGPRTRPRQKRRLEALADDLKVVEGRLLLPDDLADELPPVDRDWEDFAAEAGDDGLAAAADAAPSLDRAGGNGGGRFANIAGDDLPSQRVRAGRAVVQTMKPRPGKGALWMVHYVIPHVPWRFLPDGSQYVVDGPTMPGLNDQTWGGNRFLLDQAFQRHLLMTKFADNLLGEAIDRMQATGLWDRALVIVVADHGGEVAPHQSRRPVTKGNFPAVAGIPMFVKLPGQKEAKTDDATFTTTMDVVPTVAKQLGLDPGWRFSGVPVDEPHTDELLRQRNGRLAKLISETPERFRRRRDAALRRQLARFPSGNESIWRIGPRPDLLGRRAAGAPQAAGRSARIDNARLYGRVRPGSGVIPAYVTGETSGVRPGTELAVAVNGRIRATGEAYLEHGDPRFSFMVPPESLRRGRNIVEVFAVDGGSLTSLARTA